MANPNNSSWPSKKVPLIFFLSSMSLSIHPSIIQCSIELYKLLNNVQWRCIGCYLFSLIVKYQILSEQNNKSTNGRNSHEIGIFNIVGKFTPSNWKVHKSAKFSFDYISITTWILFYLCINS